MKGQGCMYEGFVARGVMKKIKNRRKPKGTEEERPNEVGLLDETGKESRQSTS